MSEQPLTQTQARILEFMKSEILTRGFPPSVREICAAVGLNSPASVYSQLKNLEKKGYIEKCGLKSRALRIIDDEFNPPQRECAQVPIVGNVSAGEPIFADQNITDYFPIPVDMLPNEKVFMLQIRGDSMINAGILDGDKVIVKQTGTAVNGSTVVALIDDSATVKTFYKENGHFRLQPENPDYDPIIVDHVEILGEVIGVLRLY